MKQASFVLNIILTLALVVVTVAVYPPAILSVLLAVAWRTYEYYATEESQKGMKR